MALLTHRLFYFHHEIDSNILERPTIDLSSLLYGDSIGSKLVYSFTLISSFTTVGISCARILKRGESPVIETYVSCRFMKIILLIVTRFLVQSYVLAIAVKSLMYGFVSHYQYFKPGQSARLYSEVENLYYRGLCWPGVLYVNGSYINDPKNFCDPRGPEILTFKQATLYAPLILISMVYLPSIIYVLFINFNIVGLKKFFEKFFENPLLFIFPLFTSFSFHKVIKETHGKMIPKKRKTRAKSMPLLNSMKHTLPGKPHDEEIRTKISFESESPISNIFTGSFNSFVEK